MHLITSATLLAAFACLAIASPIKTKTGLSNDIDAAINDNLNGVQVSTRDAEDSNQHLEARASIFDYCFRGLPALVTQHTISMDRYWNLAVIGRGTAGGFVSAPGNDDDLEYHAYTLRESGIAYAHLHFRVRPIAFFPARQSVRWSVTELRSGTRTCVASGTITASSDDQNARWTLDSTASYEFTIQDAYD